MTNETPETQPTAPGGQHGFDAFFSSEPRPVESTAAVPEPVLGDAVVAPQAQVAPEVEASAASESAPLATAEPDSSAEPAVVAPAPEVVAPEPFAAPGAEQVPAVHPGEPAAFPGQPAQGDHSYAASAQAYPAQSQTQAYPPVDQAQAYPGQAYRGATAAYPGAATAAYPPGGYDPNAPQYGAAAYPLPAPAPKKPMSKGLLWGLIGGAAAFVLLIVAAIAIPIALRPPQLTAGEVVENYLTAVADGDAEAALEYVDPYGDDSLLTDEVLAASNELAAISDIEVGEYSEDSYSATVPVSFRIGETLVEREFDLYDYDDGWVVSDGLTSLYLPSGFDALGLTINGVEAPESAYVFPGTYELAVANDAFTFDGDTSVFTISDSDSTEALWDISPKLSESGQATVITLITDAINECLAMKTLSTPCGWDVSDIDLSGATAVEDSVTRTITAEGKAALADLAIEYYGGTTATSYDSISVDITLEGESGGQRSTYEVWWGGYMDTPIVDFSTGTATLTWQ